MHNTKGNIKWDIKISFCSWAWPYIPLLHYTGANGTALLPQGHFELLLASSSSLPYMPFMWGVARKARRGELPRTVQQSWCGAGAPGRVPGRAKGVTAATHGAAAAHWQLCGMEDTGALLPAESCHPFTCLEAPREGVRVDPLKSLAWRMDGLRFPRREWYDFARNWQL